MLLVPLYIYPTNSSWMPIYNAIELRPTLNFTVIVNPSSGPGENPLPSDDYYTAVQKLNSYANVKTVGYVRTGYATRNITEVIDDVLTYAGWSANSSSLGMSGIFFDEAVHQYDADAVTYMETIDQVAKNATGLLGDRRVIHNPGTIPDSRYNNSYVDITVVFEDNYTAWQNKSAEVEALSEHRHLNSIMINSVPWMSDSDLKMFVNDLAAKGEHIFITGNQKSFYESFASDWFNFVDVTKSTNQ
ncbi:Spherulation-specific family 4 [Truncatella angustata]|uniref:Spherulation-specific family 4 n=1 Tax=Truncatella angustata TaxID=152316 RepID=A0A9P8UBW1_9PEZI|nr:Spherulation-specific family 4 [Truncatella angustata]KAH6645410.1 Spherulation-specific family 4 [Truncatella angustata]